MKTYSLFLYKVYNCVIMSNEIKDKAEIQELAVVAKVTYLDRLKEKYIMSLLLELVKHIPEEHKDDWEEHATLIKAALKKISKRNKAILFKEGSKVFLANTVIYFNNEDFPETKQKYAVVQYEDGYGTNRRFKSKLLNNRSSEWILLYNNERNEHGHPVADIDPNNSGDSYDLSVLVELGANLIWQSIGAKGILELLVNDKNDKFSSESVLDSVLSGVYINKTAVSSQGTGAYAKVSESALLAGGQKLNAISLVKAGDMKTHIDNLKQLESDFFSRKGAKAFEKIGTYNAHTEEVKQMQEEKVEAVLEKVIHIENNIRQILELITGKKSNFKFEIEKKMENVSSEESTKEFNEDEKIN